MTTGEQSSRRQRWTARCTGTEWRAAQAAVDGTSQQPQGTQRRNRTAFFVDARRGRVVLNRRVVAIEVRARGALHPRGRVAQAEQQSRAPLFQWPAERFRLAGELAQRGRLRIADRSGVTSA